MKQKLKEKIVKNEEKLKQIQLKIEHLLTEKDQLEKKLTRQKLTLELYESKES